MPKYLDVFNALQHEILKGKYAGGRRLPSEAELCLRYKVSRPTAARALRELQQIGVITRRAGSGSYLVLPKSAAAGSSHVLGLYVPGLRNTEILDPICNEISRFAQSLGYTVVWGDAAQPLRTGDDALQLCREFIAQKISGVFFAPMESIPDRVVWNRLIAKEFLDQGISLVLLDRDMEDLPARSEFDLVGIDNIAAAMEITEHLLVQGRKQLCFLAQHEYPATTDLRLLGCCEALRRHRIHPVKGVAHFGNPTDRKFVEELLKNVKPDAILCCNDLTAALLIRTLAELGCDVPGEVAIAGFDDVHYAALLAPSLTTIRQPCRHIARSAVKMLLERLADPTLPPRQLLHAHQLVIRQSTADNALSEISAHPSQRHAPGGHRA
jgi:DNA-binding LacI/PurR family transcriptional regulator